MFLANPNDRPTREHQVFHIALALGSLTVLANWRWTTIKKRATSAVIVRNNGNHLLFILSIKKALFLADSNVKGLCSVHIQISSMHQRVMAKASITSGCWPGRHVLQNPMR